MQKRLLFPLVIIAILISLAGVYFLNQSRPSQSSVIPVGKIHSVTLMENGFEPAEVEVAVGDVVEFKTTTDKPFWPASDLHPTHGIYPEFDPLRELSSSESWSFQFLKLGRWKYHDHLQSRFRGVVIVK